MKTRIQEYLARQTGAMDDPIHLIDGFLMPICKYARASTSRCFQGEAGFSYCAAKDEKYYGFEGHVLVSFSGIICGYALAAANIDERDALPEMVVGLHGLLVGDKGYIRPSLKQELAEQGIDLQTPLRKNMQDPRSQTLVKQLMSSRRLMETVIGQLSERFHIEKVRARDTWHLANRFIRKLLAHTIGVFLGKLLGNPLLLFEALVEEHRVSRYKVLYDGRLVADLEFSFGWKVLCQKRDSGIIRLIDDLDEAIQAAIHECKKQ